MKRSGLLSGATVALELLPKLLPDSPPVAIVAQEKSPDRPNGPLERLASLSLQGSTGAVSLAPLVPLCTLPDKPFPRNEDPIDMAQQLGTCLAELLDAGSAPAGTLYRIALCLAALAQPFMARDILSVIEPGKSDPPALLALRGYLSLHTGETEQGRRALARAAFLSRGVPDHRNILHFTQHVLLSHQFGG